MRGRKPTPDPIKILRGNPGKRALSGTVPQPTKYTAVPVPPAWLGPDGKAQWGVVASELHTLGLLTRVDAVMLEMWCCTYQEWRRAVRTVKSKGLTLTDNPGVKRPEAGLIKEYALLLVKIGSELGLSPAARQRLTALPDADAGRAADEFEQTMREGGVVVARVSGGRKVGA